jgi:DNA modification methylase
MGSGTTGRVCDNLGRSFVGYDLNYNLVCEKFLKREFIL